MRPVQSEPEWGVLLAVSPALCPGVVPCSRQVCADTDLLMVWLVLLTWVIFRCSLSRGSEASSWLLLLLPEENVVHEGDFSVCPFSFIWLLFLWSWLPCLRWVSTSNKHMYNYKTQQFLLGPMIAQTMKSVNWVLPISFCIAEIPLNQINSSSLSGKSTVLLFTEIIVLKWCSFSPSITLRSKERNTVQNCPPKA